VNDAGILCGMLTDGDLRRLLQRRIDISNLTAGQVMTQNPKVINQNMLAAQALEVMESYKITQLVVVDNDHHPVGILHLHSLVEAGLRGDSSA
jgi:arabinose-5-phosphate isomerase